MTKKDLIKVIKAEINTLICVKNITKDEKLRNDALTEIIAYRHILNMLTDNKYAEQIKQIYLEDIEKEED